jgi:hypothetical protein
MSSDSPSANLIAEQNPIHSPVTRARQRNMIWIIPIMAVLFIFGFDLFRWFMIGNSTNLERDLWTTPFIPAETPYSVGPDAR